MNKRVKLDDEDLAKVSGGVKTSTGVSIDSECTTIVDFLCPVCKDEDTGHDPTLQSYFVDFGFEMFDEYQAYCCLHCSRSYGYHKPTGTWHRLHYVSVYYNEYFESVS